MTNRDAFKALYAKYFRRVVRYFMRGFHMSEEDAQDLAQETFVRIFRKLHEYRGDAEWAYVETTALHVGCNRLRSLGTAKRGKNAIVPLEDALAKREPVAPPDPDYADRETARILRKRLHDEIARLSRAQRQCMQLWLQGHSFEQIARALTITVDAVKSRLRDARKQLKERLGEEVAGMHLPDNLPEEEQ